MNKLTMVAVGLLLAATLGAGCKNPNDTGDTVYPGGGGGDRIRGPDLGWRPVPVATQVDARPVGN
jgi:hypothetical protein